MNSVSIPVETLFSQMPDNSKVWIYQANRFLTEDELMLLHERGKEFVSQWASHGSALKADFRTAYQLFLIFCVDETQHEASGCSVDKSVHFVKELQSILKIDFFDRTRVAYFKDSETLGLSSLTEVQKLIQEGQITDKTFIFNNLIQNLKDLKMRWVVPAAQSWLARFF